MFMFILVFQQVLLQPLLLLLLLLLPFLLKPNYRPSQCIANLLNISKEK
jgi:hypothetical protein